MGWDDATEEGREKKGVDLEVMGIISRSRCLPALSPALPVLRWNWSWRWRCRSRSRGVDGRLPLPKPRTTPLGGRYLPY